MQKPETNLLANLDLLKCGPLPFVQLEQLSIEAAHLIRMQVGQSLDGSEHSGPAQYPTTTEGLRS